VLYLLIAGQIIPASYQNEAKRIIIPGVADKIIPGSPEDIRIPVPPSGFVSPLSGMGTPAMHSGIGTPSEPVNSSLLMSATSATGLVGTSAEKPKVSSPPRKPENPLSRD
jgi:6-phosphofructo-2-kinase/fructose-2,6-biphosphatase 4